MYRTIIFCLTLLFNLSLFAQTDTLNKVRYTPDYNFEDGIYLTFKDLINRKPILKSRLLTTEDYESKDFFKELMVKQQVLYFDDFGNKQAVNTSAVWGYVSNNIVYINVNNEFFRVTYLGNISHFLASYTYYTSPNYNYYNNYNYNYNTMPSNQSKEVKQMILDFETGSVASFNVKNLQLILARDPELFTEYEKLRSKKKKQLLFIYLRKYNERNPLYLTLE